LKNILQIGITGGIGSGKSLVSKIFHSLGIPVYDADRRARILMTTDVSLIKQIKKELGEESYTNGILNREYVSKTVFNNTEKLTVLNSLVHPRVATDYTRWLEQQHRSQYVLREAALLFETNSYKTLNKVIVVHAPEELRIERLLKRDKHRTEQQVRDIIRNQMPDSEKLKRADFIIVNDETQLIIPQVLDLHKNFIGQ
jgi:dephospho-CoA kinase